MWAWVTDPDPAYDGDGWPVVTVARPELVALLEPLPVDKVARVLAASGFVGEAGPVDAAYLLSAADEEGIVELGHVREAGQVQVILAGGAVRAIHVEPWAFVQAEWKLLTENFRALARYAGARFLPDDRIDD